MKMFRMRKSRRIYEAEKIRQHQLTLRPDSYMALDGPLQAILKNVQGADDDASFTTTLLLIV